MGNDRNDNNIDRHLNNTTNSKNPEAQSMTLRISVQSFHVFYRVNIIDLTMLILIGIKRLRSDCTKHKKYLYIYIYAYVKSKWIT